MNYKHWKIRFAVTVALFCLTVAAFGQGTTGSISGTVKDPNGAVVAGVSVTVTSTGATTGFRSTTTTDSEGQFLISKVPPGEYSVTTSASGFKSSSIPNIEVTLEKSTPLTITLEVGSGDVTVDVNASDTVQIELATTNLNTSFTKNVINSLPKGTTFESLLKIAPNVRLEPRAGGFQIDGASGAENVYVIDGQEVTNFRTGTLNAANLISTDLVSEVQVKSTGLAAEYGGATGGVVNVVTLGGNNRWSGSFGAAFIAAKLQGNSRPTLNRWSVPAGGNPGEYEYFQGNKPGGTSWFPTARISGPILKDKLWFSATYAPQIFVGDLRVDYYSGRNPNTRVLTESIDYSAKRTLNNALLRFDAQPTSKVRFNVNLLWNPVVDDGLLPADNEGLAGVPQSADFGGQVGLLRGAAYLKQEGGRQNSNNINGQVSWTPTSSMVLNFRAGRTFLNEKLGSYGQPTTTRYICSATNGGIPAGAGCLSGFTNFGSNFQIPYDVSTRTTFDGDSSLLFNGAGQHNLKFGYQYNRLSNSTDQGYKPYGIVTLWYGLGIDNFLGSAPTPGNIGAGRLRRFGTIGSANSANQAIFFQDSWQIAKRLTLNLGLRLESENVPTFNPANPGIKFGWGDKLAPRLGASYDLTGDGKTKLFASYGWFYDRFKYELPRGSFGGDFFRDDYFELFASRGTAYTSYTLANILGTVPDQPGGNCPGAFPSTPLPSLGNGYSVCQIDNRIPSNLVGGDIFTSGGVDPDLKAARQSEYTFGVERQLTSVLMFSGRFTHKSVDRAIEDIGFPTASGSEAYIIGNPGFGLAAETASSNGYLATKAVRRFDALEFRIDKRLSSRYFFSASYTWSRLFGNYSGLASSDEAGRTAPNVNRFFDLPFLGYTANGVADNGLLATDRPHVFKAFGGYTFNWNDSKTNTTDFSFFTSIQSGTPLTTQYNFYNATAILNERGDLGRTEMFTETDFQVSHNYKFGRDGRITFQPFLNIRNLFDERNETGRVTLISPVNFTASTLRAGGCPATVCADEVTSIQRIFNGGTKSYIDTYLAGGGVAATIAARKSNVFNLTNAFQAPREVRFGFRVFF